MNNRVIILGGGMIGSAISRDLCELGYFVSVIDKNLELSKNFEKYGINYINLDFNNKNKLVEIIKDFDIVVGAVPGFMGFEVLKIIIESKKDIVDISFMPENSKDYDEIARLNDVTVITDAGLAPGLSNLFFGQKYNEYDILDSAKCFVGGLPQKPKPPWWYKSVFSPIDVIEEYTRPARIKDKGDLIIKPALTDIESININNIGKLDAFNSDGLRSLLDLNIPNMVEKTLRFPGHIQKIIDMINNGLFDNKNIDSTVKKLFLEWTPNNEDYDQTIMKLDFVGFKDDKEIYESFELVDYYDQKNNISSMARTTGYTCCSIVDVILNKKFTKKGVFNMEDFGGNKVIVNSILDYLEKRNIKIYKI